MYKNKTRLRDFQSYLALRLSEAATSTKATSWLGVEAGEERWLLDLPDSGEIVQPPPPILPVPLTQSWFAGLSSIRGNLYAVSDFAMFRGGQPTPRAGHARLLLIGARYGFNAALLINRLLGLKKPDDLSHDGKDDGAPAWGQECFLDDQGMRWHKLVVRDLLDDKNFSNIGL